MLTKSGQGGATISQKALAGLLLRYLKAQDADQPLDEPGWVEIASTAEFAAFLADRVLSEIHHAAVQSDQVFVNPV